MIIIKNYIFSDIKACFPMYSYTCILMYRNFKRKVYSIIHCKAGKPYYYLEKKYTDKAFGC